MPTRGRSTPIEILQAFTRRLRAVIDIYNDQNCFINDQEVPTFFPGGKECCTVSPGSGAFPQALFGGGGVATLTEDMSVQVTTLVRHVRDRPAHSTQAVASQVDGLMTRRGQILAAMLADDFDLTSEDGSRYLLRDQLAPAGTSAIGPTEVGEVELVGATVTFHAPFDWLLSSPSEACSP